MPDDAVRIVITSTLTERYRVTDEALAMVPVGVDRDDYLIELFQQHDGSVYGETLFCGDASPSVGLEVEEDDDH